MANWTLFRVIKVPTIQQWAASAFHRGKKLNLLLGVIIQWLAWMFAHLEPIQTSKSLSKWSKDDKKKSFSKPSWEEQIFKPERRPEDFNSYSNKMLCVWTIHVGDEIQLQMEGMFSFFYWMQDVRVERIWEQDYFHVFFNQNPEMV